MISKAQFPLRGRGQGSLSTPPTSAGPVFDLRAAEGWTAMARLRPQEELLADLKLMETEMDLATRNGKTFSISCEARSDRLR